jgi:uncharacterized protein YkwD
LGRLHRATTSSRAGGPAARSLARAALAVALAVAVAGCGGAGIAAVPPGGPGTTEQTSAGERHWALVLLDMTNSTRAAEGLPPLVLDDAASQAAYEHCWDMDVRDYFAHSNPDGEGPAQRLARHGVACRVAGENLAKGQATPEDVIDEWMESPPHRATLLHPHWTHVGIGVHTRAEGQWWGQVFYR